ncbi:MAG: PKD domain-containing protein, partial [Thermoplasmata archaeon]|nr:PKD domain-containing protein [Thermoplasmata archaeon]
TDNATNTETLPGVDSPDAICGYDNVAPIATMTALSVYKNANFLVQWSVGVEVTSGVASWTVQCRNGSGGSWTAWLTNVSYTVRSATWLIANTTEGHMVSFRVLAVDNASNCGTWGASVSTTRDTVAPTSEVTDITPFWQNTSAITIQATASDGTSGLKYVVLYYYNSTDNLTWTGPWTSGNDTTPWSGVSWSFTFLSGSIHYRFYSRATDNATNTEGAPTTNDTICYYNNTYPNTPSSPSPANGTTYTTGDRPSGLSWTGGDINNDLVNYTLYVRASNSTLNASYIHGYTENVTSHSIIFSWSTTYYWKIVATDEHGAVSIGPIWHFTTGAESGGGGPGPSGAENTAPTAEAGGPYMEYVNATITFNASKSTDTNGRITGYKWDWTNDGTWDTDWLTNPTTTHVYTLVGSYTVKLQVKDNGSATDDDTASVTIQALPVIYASQEALDFLNSSFGLEFTTPFYGTDTNGDDVVDTFTDPNHLLTFVRFANVDGSASFLLSTGNDDIPEFFWDTTTNTITPVHHDVGAIIDTVDNTDTKTITMTISVEKANWTYIEVTDLYPDNPDLIVKTVDGRTISSEMLWRKNGKIFILDDPVTEYQIIYSYVGRSLFDVTLELTPNSVHVGADISALITLINVGEPGLVNGTVNYTLYKGGEIVWSSEENVSVLSQKTYTKTISTDGLSLGSYTYKVIYSYSGGQTASAQGIFTVDAVQQPLLENILLWAVIIIIIIIIVIVAVLFKLGYLYFDKKEK